jgi:hypothetical protein
MDRAAERKTQLIEQIERVRLTLGYVVHELRDIILADTCQEPGSDAVKRSQRLVPRDSEFADYPVEQQPETTYHGGERVD